MNHIQVKDNPNLGRDPINGGIISLNNEAYLAHVKAKQDRKKIETRLDDIENNINEIKSMFSKILDKLG